MFRPSLFALIVLAGLMALTGLRGAEPDDELHKLRQEVKKLQQQLADREQQVTKALDTITRLTTVLEAIKKEQKAIDDQIKARQDEIRQLGLQNKEYKQEAIKARTDLQSALDRNQQLLTKLIETERQLAAKGDNAGRDARNPPAKDLRGKVTAVDAATGSVTVSLGSEDGLAKGNTLEVFRLKPRPEYVGTLRIYEVKGKESTGKLLGGTSKSIQVGDEVASEILGGKKP